MKKSTILYSFGLLILPFGLLINSSHTGKTAAASPVSKDVSSGSGLPKIVSLAEAFKATLNTDQAALLQRDYSKNDAVRWSNFPQMAARPSRVGLSIGSLNPTQLAAFRALMAAALDPSTPNEGSDELEGIRAADDYFGKTTGKSEDFGSKNFFIAFLGKPSTTGLWELQYGGHHFAFSNTYNKGAITGATPSFRGVEPMKPVIVDGHSYQPVEQERRSFADVIASLDADQKKTALLNTSFNDVLMGPGQDGNFPLKKLGIKVSELSQPQREKVIKAIELYVQDLEAETAKTIMTKYIAELPDTYLSYSGTGTMDKTADYIRIDGPGVWIEYAVQPSRDFPGTTHPHSIWRDHTADYGGN